MLIIVLDIHRNILSVQSFIRCAFKNSDKFQLVLKSNSLIIKNSENSTPCDQMKISMPGNFLQPHTISSICSKNSKEFSLFRQDNFVEINFALLDVNETQSVHTLETTFRLELSSNSVFEEFILKSNAKLQFRDFMVRQLEKLEGCFIFCSNCGVLLTDKSIRFTSVHKYYEDESDSSETWFCHNHGDHKPAESAADALYIGDMHIYFHDSVLKFLSLTESDKSYKCSKCLSVVSFKKKMSKPHYIGFFADKILLAETSTEMCSINEYKKNLAVLSFCSIIESLLNLVDFCDVYLQSKADDKIEVLLLRFNSQKVLQFLFHEEKDELPSEVEFKLKEVYKVLYCVCSPDSDLSKKWKHDFRVDFFLISDNMMTVIRDLLKENSKYVSSDQETQDGFSCGYLPVYGTA